MTPDDVGRLIRYMALATWRADGWLDDDFDEKGMTHRWAAQEFVLSLTQPSRDALVAAVRDADTLRQARELAATACPGGLRHVIDRTAFDALLDLLSPAPQGEGT